MQQAKQRFNTASQSTGQRQGNGRRGYQPGCLDRADLGAGKTRAPAQVRLRPPVPATEISKLVVHHGSSRHNRVVPRRYPQIVNVQSGIRPDRTLDDKKYAKSQKDQLIKLDQDTEDCMPDGERLQSDLGAMIVAHSSLTR
jgi:hypothetical protein